MSQVLKDQFSCWQEQRTLSHSLTVQYDSVETRKLAHKRVTVFNYYYDSIKIKYNNEALPYSVFEKLRTVNQGVVSDNKHLGAVHEFAQIIIQGVPGTELGYQNMSLVPHNETKYLLVLKERQSP